MSYYDDFIYVHPEKANIMFPCRGEHASTAVHSPLFRRWLARLSPNITINSIHMQSVDVARLSTPKERVLFIKFKADAIDKRRRPLLPGIVFLRGDAVACLVILKNRGKYYALLVKQARLAVGDEILEIPAGMQDDEDDPCGTILRELEEECGLVIDRTQVTALTTKPLLTSPGLLDESVHLYFTELDVGDEELAAMHGRVHGCVDEHEHIELAIIDIEDIPTATTDLKTIAAYELWLTH